MTRTTSEMFQAALDQVAGQNLDAKAHGVRAFRRDKDLINIFPDKFTRHNALRCIPLGIAQHPANGINLTGKVGI